MDTTLNLLNILLPMLYLAVAILYAFDFFRDVPGLQRAGRALLAVAALTHAVYLGLRSMRYEHVPLASLPEVLTSVAFAITVVYLFVELTTRTHRTGLFLLSFSLVCQTASSAFIEHSIEFPKILRSPLFALHTGSVVLGYAAFGVSAIYGVLYLLLYRALKATRFGVLYERLPPLEELARMSLRAATLGFCFLTVTIALGMLWASREFPGFYTDPFFLMSATVWFVYAAGLALHHILGWGGRRTIYFSLAGFTLIVLTIVIARVWLKTFHGFA